MLLEPTSLIVKEGKVWYGWMRWNERELLMALLSDDIRVALLSDFYDEERVADNNFVVGNLQRETNAKNTSVCSTGVCGG